MDGSDNCILGFTRKDVPQCKVAAILGQWAPISTHNVQALLFHNLPCDSIKVVRKKDCTSCKVTDEVTILFCTGCSFSMDKRATSWQTVDDVQF